MSDSTLKQAVTVTKQYIKQHRALLLVIEELEKINKLDERYNELNREIAKQEQELDDVSSKLVGCRSDLDNTLQLKLEADKKAVEIVKAAQDNAMRITQAAKTNAENSILEVQQAIAKVNDQIKTDKDEHIKQMLKYKNEEKAAQVQLNTLNEELRLLRARIGT